MIFFASFLIVFPIIGLIAIPTSVITGLIEASGTDQDATKNALKHAKYGLMFTAAASAFIAIITWIIDIWVPFVKLSFGI